MSGVSPGYIKSLFHSLVKAAGGVEAAGETLGISFQRVSQLQSMNCADMPSILQVIALEAFAGQAIVTGALAKLITPPDAQKDLEAEVFDVTRAAVDLHAAVRSGADRRVVEGKVITLRREADEVQAAFGREAG